MTKDSLEIKDNLIIAGVSGSAPGDYVGAGFQLGGKVGVSGTGSAPLMSLTLGSRTLTGDSLMVNVDGQEGASFKSGSVTQAALGKAGMRFGVTGSVSGSLVQAKRAEIGSISVGKVSGVKLVGSTSVSGASGTFHTATADKVVAKQVNTTSLTASGGAMLGDALADDIAIVGGLVTDLVPQNDSKVDLGTSAKQFAEAHIDAGYIDAITVTGTSTLTTVDINGGNIDGTVIGAASALAGTFTTVVGSTSVSSSTGNFHDLTADDVTLGGLTVNSLTASNGVMIGTARTDDLSVLGGLITDLLPQNDSKVDLGSSDYQFAEAHIDAGYIDAITVTGTSTLTTVDINAGNIDGTTIGAVSVAAGSFAAVVGTTGTYSSTLSGSTITTHEVTTNKLHGTGIVTQDNLQTGSVLTAAILDTAVTTAKLAALSVTKAKLNSDVVINKTDANGGLTWTSGRLSVGWRKDTYVRADGSNISGAVPTVGMHATKAVPTPYTTASLGAQPQSGSLMVYLNGLLLHGDHIGNTLSASAGSTSPVDYHLHTGSANNHKVLLHTDLALDSDDVLTVTYLSGSGTNS